MSKQKKRWGDRKEATWVRNVDSFTTIVPYLMPTRNASSVYFKDYIDATNLMNFVKEYQKKYSYFSVTLAALVRTLALKPRMNRFVQGHRHYQRNKIVLSFTAKRQMTEDAAETVVKLGFDRTAALDDVMEKLSGGIKVAKDVENNDDTTDLLDVFKKMPRWLLRIIMPFINWLDYHGWYPKALYDFDPMMCSAYITNLGSIGLEEVPFHHLYDRGTCSIFLATGKIHKKLVYVEGQGMVEKDVMEFTVTLDERISDGFYYLQAIKLFKNLMENPEVLLERPAEVPDDL